MPGYPRPASPYHRPGWRPAQPPARSNYRCELCMNRPKVLLADDHVLVVQALEHMLQAEFDVVGTVSDGRALLKAAGELLPDVVVVDVGMPLLNGLDAAEEMKVIVLTQNREPRFAVEAFRRHASGYLLKDSAVSELTRAIREALRGKSYVSPAIAKGMVDETVAPHAGEIELRDLSAREREVLQLLAEGKSMKEVAALLDISPRTVEFHKYRIMELLRVKTNAELVQQAIKLGLIAP